VAFCSRANASGAIAKLAFPPVRRRDKPDGMTAPGLISDATTDSTIAAMLPWQIWLDPRSIGSSDEETIAMAQGQIGLERAAELREKTQQAFESLRDATPAGIQDWMRLSRAAN
jgi:hypothetical protein